ncbi:MAG TPA: hypothetical protein VFX59_00925 [Polyangiales bacterium]|nr:hypothetical protein [Polyangiales bacterium]
MTSSTSLLPNDTRELSVVYRGADGKPQAGILIDFSLVGAAAGASLSPIKANTEGVEGIAKTTLRAGSTASDLQVRARAGTNAAPAYLPLSVRSAFGSKLAVGVQYSGERTIASYTVTSLTGMSCALALSSGAAGESTFHFNAPDGEASFELGYGLSAALVGWGKDDTGSKLVRGCQEFTAPVNENAAATQTLVTLALTDIDLSFGSGLEVELQVNASASARRFAEASTRAVAAVVSPSYTMFADADYLLDAVQSQLSAQGDLTGASTLATRRTAASLAASLQPALSAQKAGPTAYGDATGAELARRAASLVLRWTIGAAALSAASAQSADGSQTLALTVPQASIVTRFVPASAELAIDALRVDLGLGSLGKTLLAALDVDSRAAGCTSVFGTWWTKSSLTDIASAADAQAACVAALGKLDSAVESELLTLDANRASFQLGGAVPVHARNDKGVVDDLGPGAIAGTWGTDALQASLQSPQRTAFQ